jgi:hypothetical protein
MSRMAVAAPVLTAAHRRAIEMASRQARRSTLSMDDIDGTLIGSSLRVLYEHVDASQRLHLLRAELEGIRWQSAEEGVDLGMSLHNAITLLDDLREYATNTQIIAVTAALEGLDQTMSDQIARRQALNDAEDILVETFTRMGLHVTVQSMDDAVAIDGVDGDDEVAHAVFDARNGVVVFDFEDPKTIVHELHPAAGEPCETAVTRANQAHQTAQEIAEYKATGISVGAAIQNGPGTRGGARLSRIRPTSGGHRARQQGRSL